MTILNYLLSGIFVSLGWLARGQFGHEEGAMIPGAMAAASVAVLMPSDIWKKSFAQAAIWAMIGFALGGGFSFGKLVGEITSSPSLSEALPQLLQVFVIGAIWGGLGMNYLGFALAQQATKTEIALYLATAGIIWFVNNIVNLADYQALAVGLAAIVWLYLYGRATKRHTMAAFFGRVGFVGFGLGFLISTLILYWGTKGYLSGTWWKVSDMIWGFIGGLSVYFAAVTCGKKGCLPVPTSNITLERIGFIFYAVLLTGINLLNVYQKWFKSSPPVSDTTLAWTLIITGAIAIILAGIYFLKTQPESFSPPALDSTLSVSLIFGILFLTFFAIAKSIVYSGWSAWEPGFCVISIEAVILSIVIPCLLKSQSKN